MNKKIFTLLLLVFVLISMSAVSSADLNDTDTALAVSDSSDIVAAPANNNSDVIGINENQDTLQVPDSGENMLGDGETGTFTEFKNLVGHSGEYTLTKDYKFDPAVDDSPYIEIQGSMIIHGAGHTIDYSSASAQSVFWVSSANGLTLDNIVFMNGESTMAPFITKADYLNNVHFINIKSPKAIVQVDSQGTVQNCYFIGNDAPSMIKVAMNINNNVFLDNKVGQYVIDADGYEVESFKNNAFINTNNNNNFDWVQSESGNYKYNSGDLTITGPSEITEDSEYSISLPNSAASIPNFDLMVDITSEYANVTPTTITLGGGNTATVTVSPKKTGTATLTVGSDLVNMNALGTKDIEVTADKPKTSVVISDYPGSVEITEGDAGNFYVYVYDNLQDANPIDGVNVNLTAGDTVVNAVSDAMGQASFDLSSVPAGTYTPSVVVDDENYESNTITFSLTVNEKVKTSVVISDFPGSVVITEGDAGNFYVYVYDNLQDANPIDGVNVKLTAGDTVVNAVSDAIGQASFDLSSVPAGNYTPSVVVDDENYESNAITFSLTVNEKVKTSVNLEMIDYPSAPITEGDSAQIKCYVYTQDGSIATGISDVNVRATIDKDYDVVSSKLYCSCCCS